MDAGQINPRRYGLGERRFGAVNWLGLWTLVERETARFVSVYSQTLIAPIVTAGLFLVVFKLALAERRGDVAGVPFEVFLAPGVVMMTVIQNAFANTSSSIMIAKIQGNIVDSLTPPLSAHELTVGFAAGGAMRGLMIGILASIALFLPLGVGLHAPLWALFFTIVGSLQLGLIGIAAGLWSRKFDHMAAITNFVVTPLSFLSGTFYLVSELPSPFDQIIWINPMFFLIDGFRYAALGVSDVSPWLSAGVSLAVFGGCYLLCWRLFATGYRLKS